LTFSDKVLHKVGGFAMAAEVIVALHVRFLSTEAPAEDPSTCGRWPPLTELPDWDAFENGLLNFAKGPAMFQLLS
jgi:hypothetical protein